MIKIILLPIILVGCTAPVTDPPAHACSPRLDGEPTFCPDPDVVLDLKPKPLIPKQELKGEIDIYEPMHWYQMQMMFQRNARRKNIEKNATTPTDAINNALLEFNHGSNDTPKSQELLQLQSDGDQEGT